MRRSNWPDQLVSAITRAYSTTDSRGWFPFSPDRLQPYYYNAFSERLWRVAEFVGRQEIDFKEIVDGMSHYGNLRDELEYLLEWWAHGELRMDRPKFRRTCQFLIDILNQACPNDPFSANGAFPKWPRQLVIECENNTSWIKAKPDNARDVGRLLVALNMLAYSLYTDIFAIAVGDASHGPYQLSNGELLLVRDYTDLAPAELWPETKQSHVKAVRVLTVYTAGTDVQIDFYTNLVSHSNLVDNLSRFAVEVNAEHEREVDLPKLYSSIGQEAVSQYRRLRALSDEEMKRAFLTIHCYFERELFSIAGLDWRPSQAMLDAIRDKRLLPEVSDWNDEKTLAALLRKSLSAVLDS